MPPLLALLPEIETWFATNAATIGAVSGLAGAGISGGEAIANAVGGKPNATAPSTPAPTPPNAQQLLQQKELVSQQLPNVVGATSGLASPSYDSLISQILSGVLGQPGANAAGAGATGQSFTPANNAATTAAVNDQVPSLSNFLDQFSQ
jgi:hypothetical protein